MMLRERHILSWWSVRQQCLFSVCSSVVDFKLLRRLSLVADVVTTAFGQLQATNSNSFHAIITLFVSHQSLHSEHHKINKSLRFKKTHDWHIFVYKFPVISDIHRSVTLLKLHFHGDFIILNFKWLEWWKKHSSPRKCGFVLMCSHAHKKCIFLYWGGEMSVHFLKICDFFF